MGTRILYRASLALLPMAIAGDSNDELEKRLWKPLKNYEARRYFRVLGLHSRPALS